MESVEFTEFQLYRIPLNIRAEGRAGQEEHTEVSILKFSLLCKRQQAPAFLGGSSSCRWLGYTERGADVYY
jgi:hypothetical protein